MGEDEVHNGVGNLGPTILAVDWVFWSLSTTIVLLRLGTRTWITRNFGWDDTTIGFALALNVVGKSFTIEEVANGLGQQNQDLSPASYTEYLKYNYFDWNQVFLNLPLAKISICLFLLRLSQFNRLQHVLYGLIAFTVATHIPLFVLILLQCNPIRKNWDTDIKGRCYSRETVEKIIIAQGVFSIVVDFICAAFPIVLLRNARIEIRTKIGLCLLMGLGLLTGIACIVRTALSWQIKSPDIRVGVPNAIARIIEVNLGNIAACAPIMKPFVHYVHARISGRDPHGILRHSSTTTTTAQPGWHYRWYSRFWPSHRVARLGSNAPDLLFSDPTTTPPAETREHGCGLRLPSHFRTRWPRSKNRNPLSVSLDLPVQNFSRRDSYDNEEERDSEAVDSKGGVRSEWGRRWDVHGSI